MADPTDPPDSPADLIVPGETIAAGDPVQVPTPGHLARLREVDEDRYERDAERWLG